MAVLRAPSGNKRVPIAAKFDIRALNSLGNFSHNDRLEA
jgi:hypothetical protein